MQCAGLALIDEPPVLDESETFSITVCINYSNEDQAAWVWGNHNDLSDPPLSDQSPNPTGKGKDEKRIREGRKWR
jgi:hypothetical protein